MVRRTGLEIGVMLQSELNFKFDFNRGGNRNFFIIFFKTVAQWNKYRLKLKQTFKKKSEQNFYPLSVLYNQHEI